jgi:hypothetical protein
MDIDGRAGATSVAVAGGTPANSDIYLTSTPRQRPQAVLGKPALPTQRIHDAGGQDYRLLNKNEVRRQGTL